VSHPLSYYRKSAMKRAKLQGMAPAKSETDETVKTEK
jgi:hypothetical protein